MIVKDLFEVPATGRKLWSHMQARLGPAGFQGDPVALAVTGLPVEVQRMSEWST